MPKTQRNWDREKNILAMYRSGLNYKQIAKVFNLSPQRIHQITKRNNVSGDDGGQKKILDAKRDARIRDMNERYKRRYGCDFNTYRKILKLKDSEGKSPQNRYRRQRSNAKIRNIEWRFDFYTWWLIWQESGKWNKRGRNLGQYVMGRKDDKGPYSVDNVEIITCSANISDGYAYINKGR